MELYDRKQLKIAQITNSLKYWNYGEKKLNKILKELR